MKPCVPRLPISLVNTPNSLVVVVSSVTLLSTCYPLEEGAGYEFHNDIKGGVIPGEFIPGVDKGIREQLKSGPLAGYPVVIVGVRLHFGSYHDVDSSELAFKIAALWRSKSGFMKHNPVLLEPS